MSHTVGVTTTDYIWDPSAGSGQAVGAGLPLVLQAGDQTYVRTSLLSDLV